MLYLEGSVEAGLAEGVGAGHGDRGGEDAEADGTLHLPLHLVHQILPSREDLGLDISPQPLVQLVTVHGLQHVGWNLDLGHPS